MKKPLLLILICLTYLPLSSQNWQKLYDDSQEFWGEDWQACSEILEKAIIEAKSEFGESDSNYAITLNSLGSCYYVLGRYSEALPLLQGAAKITEKTHGKDASFYGDILNTLGIVHQSMGQYEVALPIALETLINTEKNYGKTNQDYGISLNNIGTIYRQMGKYEEALKYLKQSLVVFEQSLGKQHPFYGSILNNLGNIYNNIGQYEAALPILQESIKNIEHNHGKEDPRYGHAQASLGRLYQDMDRYEEALPLLQNALTNIEHSLGKDHPEYGNKLDNLGTLYQQLGEYDAALPLLQQALAHTAKKLGKEHPKYGKRLNNLGSLYKNMGQYDKVLPLFQEALTNLELNVGKQHPVYGNQLNNLGSIHMDLGQYKEAFPLFQEAIGIAEKSLSKQNIDYWVSSSSLGHYYSKTHQYELAITYLKKSLSNTEKILGKNHDLTGIRIGILGGTYDRMDQPESALPYMLESFEVLSSQLATQFDALNSRLQRSFLRKKAHISNQISSFQFSHPSHKEIHGVGFDQELLLKGFLQNQRTDLLQSLRIHPDTNVQHKYVEWERLHKILARQYQRPINKRLMSFDSLRNHADELEISLAQQSQTFRKARRQVRWKEVQAVLKPREAAIEFTHFRFFNKGFITDSVMYVAIIIQAGNEYPKMAPLFEESALKQLLLEGDKELVFDQLYTHRGIRPKKAQPDYKNLEDLIWKPIDSLLTGVETIYYSPSGLLNRMNFNAIPLDKKTLLSDKYELIQLGSTRSLVFDAGESTTYSDKTALIFGGIQYEKDSTSKILTMRSDNIKTTSDNSELDDFAIASRGKSSQWEFLEGTAIEIQKIGQLLSGKGYQIDMRSGYNATEKSLKNVESSPRILHIATHGYFFPDPKDISAQNSHDPNQLPPVQLSDHPMVRSGLILAGANHAWTGNSIPNGQEDGILTAYEISRMDLSNTELVVLSACETGLGDIEGNEGVYGLQRAFKIAGVKYILMSLWQVPDQATQELMTAFYEEWLGGMEIREAFRSAQKQMRKKYKEPYFWAGFVLVE